MTRKKDIYVNKICSVCKKPFKVRDYRIKTAKFCSHRCHSKSCIGEKHSPEHIAKLRGRVPWNKCEKVEIICKICGKIFKEIPYYKGRKIYCSPQCRGKDFRGDRHPMWVGGKHINRRGYISMCATNHPNRHNSYYLEHRIVMEKHIGRYLDPKEVVHHINKNPLDNRIENLMLFPNNGAHRGYHRWHK